MSRAARLHRFVAALNREPLTREQVLDHLGIGLRTFYRELELLRGCGIDVRQEGRLYRLRTPGWKAEGRLPFPDPRLTFSEMAELARCPCAAGRRLAAILARVTRLASLPPREPAV